MAVTSNNPHNVSASRSNFTVNHGQPFRATVAYFTDDPSFTPSDYHIVIDWGDGTPTSGGSVIADSKHPGHFMIFGTHNYAAKVNRNVHVTIFDNNNHQLASRPRPCDCALSAKYMLNPTGGGEGVSTSRITKDNANTRHQHRK